ncbi:TPA: hypothetical protein ACS7XF_000049 [Providencia alcalifaciens]
MKKLLLLSILFSSSLYASEADVGKVCKAASAAMFGRDHKIMQLEKIESAVAYVHYIKPVDGTRWAIKCKLIGNQVMWASNNPDSIGRWRDDPLDEKVFYNVKDDQLSITEMYSDGSNIKKTYPVKEL